MGHEYKEEESLNMEFGKALTSIAEGRSPKIIAENIAGAIEQEIIRHHSGMKQNQDEFYNLIINLVHVIQKHFDASLDIWKDRVIYLKGVREVWIACEPMLDLVNTSEGSFDLLKRQLRHVDRITYFLHNTTYFNELLRTLQAESLDIRKLTCVKLREPYTVPLVIYHTDTYKHGMCGKYHPRIKRQADGTYVLERPLETDWMNYLSKEWMEVHFKRLNEFI